MPDFPLMGPDGFAAAVAFNLLFGRSHDRSKRLSELKTSGFTDKSKKTTCPVCGRTAAGQHSPNKKGWRTRAIPFA